MTAAGEIILVGRDDPALRTLVSQLRAVAGVEPLLAPDAATAKQRLGGSWAGLVRMVVVAVETLLDPAPVVRELAFLYRGTPVVAVAVKGSVHQAKEMIGVGAADYLLLPVTQEVLAALLVRFQDHAFNPDLGRGRRLVTADPIMQKLLTQVRRVASSKVTVLIQGESGTGKELFARYIHQVSERAGGPFVAVNCAALPENLLESELFGHAKGAFTGAVTDRKGKFQAAEGGTLLLDEISEMSLNLQAKLLRVLQEGEVDPVGGRAPVKLDVRVVASTNRDLKGWVAEGRFREDLYYRLNVFPLQLPPLRARKSDIPLLADNFRIRFIGELGRNAIGFAPDAVRAMQVYPWPGNVRELENTIQRALLVAEGQSIGAGDLMLELDDLPELMAPPLPGVGPVDEGELRFAVGTTVREMEELLIRRTLDEVDGNRTRAAELLGISIRTLRNKLNEYSLRDR